MNAIKDVIDRRVAPTIVSMGMILVGFFIFVGSAAAEKPGTKEIEGFKSNSLRITT